MDPSSFFTLGAASYLDELPGYREHAVRLNPVLRDGFGWLYERVFEFLGKREWEWSTKERLMFTATSSRSIRTRRRISSALTSAPSARTTATFTAWPSTASVTPTAAASMTPGILQITDSISRGLTFSPRVLITSSLRATK